MSIQAVSSVSIFQALQNNSDRRPELRPFTAQQSDIGGAELTGQQAHSFWQQRKADLEQLGDALRAGNTDAAQQAYDVLVALGKNGPLRNGDTFHRADRAQDFAAIGEALASGDLAGAQAAFAALATSFAHGTPTAGGPPGPPTPIPPQGGPPGPPTPIPPQGTLPPGPPTPIPPQAGPPGPPTRIHPPTAAGGGPSGSHEIVNFNGGGNYQRALNLLEPASKGVAQNSSLSLKA